MGRLFNPKRHSQVYQPPVNGRERGPKSRTQTRCPFHGMWIGDRFFYPVNPMRNASSPHRCVLLSRRALGQAITKRCAQFRQERYKITKGEYGWWCERIEDGPQRRRKPKSEHVWIKRSMFDRGGSSSEHRAIRRAMFTRVSPMID